jgi:sigma-B regulation protein RsbU (phosphoserine phosphatase)
VKSLNPKTVSDSLYLVLADRLISDYSGDAYRLACLESRGGNRSAEYRAELPGLDVWVSCRPLQPAISGGDLYYLSVCSQGSISRVTVADVAGHGESVSAIAEHLRDALREHADDWDQSALIRQLNDGFLKGARGGQYATFFLLSHYAATGELLFTNAGHVPPLWRRAALREWTFLQDATPYSKEIADLPLGMIPGTAYRQTAVQLEPDDLLLLYTDGVNESQDGHGEQLGLNRLLEIADSLPDGSPAAAGEALLAAVAQYRGDTPPADDETVVVLQRRPHLAGRAC